MSLSLSEGLLPTYQAKGNQGHPMLCQMKMARLSMPQVMLAYQTLWLIAQQVVLSWGLFVRQLAKNINFFIFTFGGSIVLVTYFLMRLLT